MEYIIVQAGGKGTRLGYLTKNKPKALVPVDNLPMLFHLFRKYPEKKEKSIIMRIFSSLKESYKVKSLEKGIL